MSPKTLAEIVGFLIAAAAIGLAIGFFIGVGSKAAKSLWTRQRKFAREMEQLELRHQAERIWYTARIAKLESELATSMEQTAAWERSHALFTAEFKQMSELNLAKFSNLDELRNQYDIVWQELKGQREIERKAITTTN